MHTVDVLIPTYNPKPAHLTEALENLQKQTFQDWHAFIHDDCSPENQTEAIVKPFLSDTRITFKKSDTRLGIGGNWNACVAHTSAPIVAFLFQDDVWLPDYLAQANDVLTKHPTVGLVSMEHDYHFEEKIPDTGCYLSVQKVKQTLTGGFHEGKDLFRWWLARELHPNFIGEPSFVVMRRTALEAAGPFLEDMPQALDMEAWMRMLLVSDWYDERKQHYGSFRIHSGAASARNAEGGHGLFDRLRCFEIVIALLSGKDRSNAIAARNRSIDTMVAKYFARVQSGAYVTGKGSGRLKQFCLRHPLIIGKSVCKYFLKKIFS